MATCRHRDPLNSGPHAGAIDVILSDKENGLVISGGDDGGPPRLASRILLWSAFHDSEAFSVGGLSTRSTAPRRTTIMASWSGIPGDGLRAWPETFGAIAKVRNSHAQGGAHSAVLNSAARCGMKLPHAELTLGGDRDEALHIQHIEPACCVSVLRLQPQQEQLLYGA